MEIRSVNISIEITCLIFSAALLVSILTTKAHKNKLTRILLWMLVVNCVTLACDAMAWGFAGAPGPGMRALMITANFLGFAMSYLQLILSTYYIVTYIALRQARVSKWFLRIVVLLASGTLAAIIISQFNGVIYWINENNFFATGPLYYFPFIISTALQFAFLALVLYYRKNFAGRDFGAMLFFILSIAAALVAELFVNEIMFGYMMTSVSLVVLFVLIHFRQEIENTERETEYQTSIMLSQIQPHFLYNSLEAINKLYFKDAREGNAAMVKFSKYLRGNMDSLAQKDLIPFEKELEHVKQYLWLEELRFGEKLRVVYDIHTAGFYLPVLTLQPIVENAVRHGVTKNEEGGVLRIGVREQERCYRIEVEDDGVGFAPGAQPDDSRSHNGISNVRDRLKTMCGGSLTIKSAPGEGTAAIIEIPKQEGAEP